MNTCRNYYQFLKFILINHNLYEYIYKHTYKLYIYNIYYIYI